MRQENFMMANGSQTLLKEEANLRQDSLFMKASSRMEKCLARFTIRSHFDCVIHYSFQGVIKWASGDMYEGDFKDGMLDGQGTLTCKDGNRYKGDWHKNMVSISFCFDG